MIKLFWNTQNQKKPSSTDKKIKEKQESDIIWGLYHKKNSDKWVYEILEKIQYKIITSERELQKGDSLIIIDSSVEEKIKFYIKLSEMCSKIYLFHTKFIEVSLKFQSHQLARVRVKFSSSKCLLSLDFKIASLKFQI